MSEWADEVRRLRDWREKNETEERCRIQGHPENRPAKFRMTSGAFHYCIWCFRCKRAVTGEVLGTNGPWLSKDAATKMVEGAGAKMDELPIVSHEPSTLRICYCCKRLQFCEDDHVAERVIHKELADKLPIVPLCTHCHQLKTHNLQEFMRRLRGGSAA